MGDLIFHRVTAAEKNKESSGASKTKGKERIKTVIPNLNKTLRMVSTWKIPHPFVISDPKCVDWAKEQLSAWSGDAKANPNIYVLGFVSHDKLAAKEGKDKIPFLIKVLMLNLTLVAFFIQVIVPVVIGSTLPVGEGGLCPNKAKPLGKLIGLTMCLFFVVLTVSLCLSKLSGMAFLRLFCASNSLVGRNKYFLDVGILANMISMGAVGVCQYLLFIRNAQKDDYFLLVIQSVTMHFVLSPDQRLMTGTWAAFTKNKLDVLKDHENDSLKAEGLVAVEDQNYLSQEVLNKVRLKYISEALFLASVVVVGLGWTITLTYCM